nr:hypothetical protein CFP56_17341 [Quercus suber]
MRIKVRIDPWLLVFSGFMLRLDDGSRVWIQCRYEQIHKLCTRCGLIGHTRGQCTHNMDDIEIMLYRQRLRIQDIHQVQYRFDTLQPQFSNYLRASHNRRRRWTTQVCFGPSHHDHVHASHQPFPTAFPDPSTPSSEHSFHASSPLAQPNLYNDSIRSVVNIPNLNSNPPPTPSNPVPPQPNPVPPHVPLENNTPEARVNPMTHNPLPSPDFSLASSTIGTPDPDTEELNQLLRSSDPPTLNTPPPHNTNEPPFSMRPSWYPPAESNLKWTWIEGNGPFITNGQSNQPQFENSDSDSDTTAIMFNLDRLNDKRPEIVQEQGWAKGCIPESPDSFVESLVQRVDRGRFRFELVLQDFVNLKLKVRGIPGMNGRENEAFVMERLDKAYASIEWINSYPHYALQNHPILRSDHGSILLEFELQHPFRRRPFHFERMWLNHIDCKEMVEKAWKTHSVGSRAFKLQQKLKSVKKQLIVWNKTVFARDMEGRVIFTGGASKGRQILYLALLEAVSEAIYKAKIWALMKLSYSVIAKGWNKYAIKLNLRLGRSSLLFLTWSSFNSKDL